jgi:DNA-binding NarL/FixJ family response regulator
VAESRTQVRWISPKLLKRENVVRIGQQGCVSFRVFIVDRDSMTSDLLANALARDCGFESAVIQAGDLLSVLSSSDVDLVVIGAEIDLKPGNGFNLALSVAHAHPGVSIVILLNNPSHDSVITAFRSGATGVFSRQLPMSEFLDCVGIQHIHQRFWLYRLACSNNLLELRAYASHQCFRRNILCFVCE